MQRFNDFLFFILVKNRIKTIYALLIVLIFTFIYDRISVNRDLSVNSVYANSVRFDLPEILKKGKITVLAENSSTSFFIYRGKKMGFEYEVLKEFANELGVELEVKIVDNLDDITKRLNEGEGDIVACNRSEERRVGKECC